MFNTCGTKTLAIGLLITSILIPSQIKAQSNQDKSSDASMRSTKIIPGMFHKEFAALGKRMNEAGKEKTTYSGQFFDKNGNSKKAKIICQLPGLIRLEGFHADDTVVSYNGAQEGGIKDRKNDEVLIETFLVDTQEGMLESMSNGAAVRLIGRGFGPDPSLDQKYAGPRYDIYEVTSVIKSRQDKAMRMKLYYFDSLTGLLQSTRYYDRSVSPPVKHETRFSTWGSLDGSAYPAQIEHYIDGKLAFSFIAEGIVAGPADDANAY